MSDKQNILAALENALREEGIEIGRQQGYAEGYAQAIADMSAFLKDREAPTPSSTPEVSDDPDRQRRPKGANAKLIREALERASGPKAPNAIRDWIAKNHDVRITYSSTRNALFQLQAEGVVEEDNGLWSFVEVPV